MFACMSSNLDHTCTPAALLTGFRALLRKCQLTYSDSILQRKDFEFHNWGMVVSVCRSKTIQFGQHELLIPVSKVNNSDLCTVYWCLKHFREAYVSAESLAFQIPTGDGGFRPLDYPSSQATIKHFANCAGLDPDHFSSHSLGRGGCTFLAIQGASIEEMKTRGDWSSDTVFSYISLPLSERIMSDMRVATALDAIL